jgi:ribosomal protein S27E
VADRVSQDVAEVLVTPTDQKARISQDVAEVLTTPTDQKARISQDVAEVLVQNTEQTITAEVVVFRPREPSAV